MNDAGREFSNIGQLALLPGRQGVGNLGQSERDWFMISPDGEFAAFQVMAEVSDGRINTVELPVEGAVGQLGLLQLGREESQWPPLLCW